MNIPDYELHFIEIGISKVPTFCFYLPKEEAGRNDVLIFVETYECKNGEDIQYRVWAQLEKDFVRLFITGNQIKRPQNPACLEGTIMNDLGTSTNFHDKIAEFIAMRNMTG